MYLQRRALLSPALLCDGSHCNMATGSPPITTFAKVELAVSDGISHIQSVATRLSVIQTEVLKDVHP